MGSRCSLLWYYSRGTVYEEEYVNVLFRRLHLSGKDCNQRISDLWRYLGSVQMRSQKCAWAKGPVGLSGVRHTGRGMAVVNSGHLHLNGQVPMWSWTIFKQGTAFSMRLEQTHASKLEARCLNDSLPHSTHSYYPIFNIHQILCVFKSETKLLRQITIRNITFKT